MPAWLRSPFLRFLLYRAVTAALVLIGVTVVAFVLMHIANPNPIVAWLGKTVADNPAIVAIYTQEFHFNSPLYIQYFYYLNALIHGYWGFSVFMGMPVLTVITDLFPYTAQLMILSTLFVILFTILAATASARFVHRWPDKVIHVVSLLGISTPSFYIALLVVVIVSVLRILPTSGGISPSVSAPISLTGIPMLDALLRGNWPAFSSLLAHALAPSLVLAASVFAFPTRVVRSSILKALDSKFITAARARGLSEGRVFFYAFRESLIPFVTLVGVALIMIIGSDPFVEYVFGYPGVGLYAVNAILGLDYPGVLAITILYAMMIVIISVVSDMLYAIIDPRVRIGSL
jgi:peptide/nickel transport system permease protein